MSRIFKSQELKKVDEQILSVLCDAPAPQTAQSIRARLQQDHDNGPLYGSIYSSLARLQQRGLIDGRGSIKSANVSARRQSVFRCTQDGKSLVKKQAAPVEPLTLEYEL